MQPARVALFAPGSNERVMIKAMASGADAAILDLEDSVPLNAKAAARSLAAKVIDAAARPAPAIYVRVNAAATAFLTDDLAAVVRPGLDTVHARIKVLEKSETSNAERGVMKRQSQVLNQRGEVVQEGVQVFLLKRRPAA